METEVIVAKAEFYLMLSRAFLPPTSADSHIAFTRDLPIELKEIAVAAGYALEKEIDAYAASTGELTDRIALLQSYSGFFLMPPREVQLHASVYLDGTILGRSCDALEVFYRKHGLARSEDFHDLPDHLSAILEFLALLYAKAAETGAYPRADLLNDATELNRHFLLSWVPIMRRQLARMQQEEIDQRGAEGSPTVYPKLTEILESALIVDAGELSAHLRKVLSPESSIELPNEDAKEMARCIVCAADIAPAARIRRVKKVLEKEGINTDHLDLCPKCRGVDLSPMGLRPGVLMA